MGSEFVDLIIRRFGGINNGCAYSQDKLRNLGRISVVKAVQTIPLFFFHEKKQVSTGSAYAIG
jgi:hypothetical protein